MCICPYNSACLSDPNLETPDLEIPDLEPHNLAVSIQIKTVDFIVDKTHINQNTSFELIHNGYLSCECDCEKNVNKRLQVK
jgi:hypothetical protein